jgi:glycine oxidase
VRIIVVGAGIVGCAIAHELASRGAAVHLVDSRGAARGATRASAGILAPTIEGHTPALRRLAASSLALYDDFVRRVERASGRRLDYRRTGSVRVSYGAGVEPELVAEARSLGEAGIGHELLDRDELRRVLPGLSARATAGLLVPEHGYVRAVDLTLALLAAAVAGGARITASPVHEVDARPDGLRVRIDGDTLEADAVVVASGSWPVDVRPDHAPAVTPIRGQLLHLHADAASLSRVVWGPDCYLVPWQDGSTLVGATVEDVGFDERSTAEGVRDLLAAAVELMPALRGAALRDVRVGLRPRASDELPVIGRSPSMPGVYYALGHYRNGVLLSPLTAMLIADLVLDGRERDELELVRPERLELA